MLKPMLKPSHCIRRTLPISRRFLRVQRTTASARVKGVSRPSVERLFHYSKAIVCGIPNSFVKGALKIAEPQEPINLEKAKEEHRNYVQKLREYIPTVIEIDPDDRYPDMVFVEDPAVVLMNKAIICKLGHPSRQGETEVMKKTLESIGIETYDVQAIDDRATIDGGDVLFTGREFLVGLSRRTNKYGIEALAKVFNEWPVTAVHINPEVLHLKSMSSMAGVDLIAIGDTPAGRRAWTDIERNASFKDYNKLVFPDGIGANCLFVNGTVFHVSQTDYPDSCKVWETLDVARVEQSNSELSKADSALTCCSILIQ